jgi:hypothetical protein
MDRQMKHGGQRKGAGRKPAPTRRAKRYGNLIPAWRWRTTPERLEQMEEKRKSMGIGKTEFIEIAVDRLINDAQQRLAR